MTQRNQPAFTPPRLSPEAIAYLRLQGREVECRDGDLVVTRGEPGKAFHVVLSGEIEVRLRGEDGSVLPLTTLGEGCFFGEMSLLTDTPISADAAAVGPVSLLQYPGEKFLQALADCEPLRHQVLAGLASNLRSTSSEAWHLYQRMRTLNILLDLRSKSEPLVTESQAMKKLQRTLEGLRSGRQPVMVCGEPGAGKIFVAARIHQERLGLEAPFIVLDCRTFCCEDGRTILFGDPPPDGAIPSDRAVLGPLRPYGAVHLARRGTLVLRHVDSLGHTSQERLLEHLDEREGQPPLHLLATSRKEPKALVEEGFLHPRLGELLAGQVVLVPPLRERRRDILPLARFFLQRCPGESGLYFSDNAEKDLLSGTYAHRNASELREAVEMAVLFADGEEIRSEHIFTGPTEDEKEPAFDVSRSGLGRLFLRPSFVTAARGIIAVVFLSIAAVSLVGGDSLPAHFANGLTWGFWEPALLLSFLLLGRVWCTFCPLSSMAAALGRFGRLERPPPRWMKRYLPWLVTAGFLAIVLSEIAYDMFSRPRAAALLLLVLLGAAVLFTLLYERESWCRYLCPLGNLGALFSPVAITAIRVNPHLCRTRCQGHECFRGPDGKGGCPTFHHPLFTRDAPFCKLCLQCLRVCPHGSARLTLRPPLQSIWRLPDLGDALVPFALFLFAFAPFLPAFQTGLIEPAPSRLATVTLISLAAALSGRPLLDRLVPAGTGGDPAILARLSFALVILAWGPIMAYQLGHVPALADVVLSVRESSSLAPFFPSAGLSLRLLLQLGSLAFAAAGAALAFRGIRSRAGRTHSGDVNRAWRNLHMLGALYLAATMVIYLVPAG